MTRKVATIAYFGAIASFGLAILLYRGGNFANNTLHFQWTTNFISDLGLSSATVTASTQPLVRLLFTAAMLSTGLATVGAVTTIKPSGRARIIVETTLAIGVAGLAVAVSLIPSDVNNFTHRLVLVGALMLAAALWSLMIRSQSDYQKNITGLTAVVLWAYLLFILIAPHPEASQLFGLIHAQVEKSVFLVYLVSLGFIVFNSPIDQS